MRCKVQLYIAGKVFDEIVEAHAYIKQHKKSSSQSGTVIPH